MPKGVYNTFIQLEIGELKLHQTQDHLMSIQNTRVSSDMTTNVIVSLYDDSAFAVEAAILAGGLNFSFEYGYVNGKRSAIYNADISHLGAEMTAKGMILTIEGTPSGATKTNEATTRSWAGMTINEIVAAIANEQGWSITVNVPCKKQYIDDEKTELKTYLQEGLGYEEFIRKILIPDAVPEVDSDKLGNYEFFLDTKNGKKYASFLPKGYNNDAVAATFTYIIGQEHEKIISFTPNYNEWLITAMGGNGVKTTGLGDKSNSKISYELLKKPAKNPTVKANTLVMGSTYTADEIETISRNAWNQLASAIHTADLVLVGDPGLSPMQYIEVVVLTPSNTLHHTSGRYYIEKIEDMVDVGEYTTTLNLTKSNDISYGVTAQVEGTEPVTDPSVSAEPSTQAPNTSGFVGPITGWASHVTSRFGWRTLRGKPNQHKGIDIGMPTGTIIYAAKDGTVTVPVFDADGYGNWVKMDHGNGQETRYGHCSEILVKTGQKVKAGDPIAKVGSTGNSTGPHLHFEVRINGVAQNPESFIS